MAIKKEKITKKLIGVAYHEAGHAYACYRLGVKFKYVSIISEEGAAGHIRLRLPFTNRDFEIFEYGGSNDYSALALKARMRIEISVIILCAGHVSKAHYCKRVARSSGFVDRQEALKIAGHLHSSGTKTLEQYLVYLFAVTEEMITNPNSWKFIEVIAKGLLEHRKLKYQQIVDLIRKYIDEELKQYKGALPKIISLDDDQ